MEQLDTPGKRLRHFSATFFTTVTAFAHELGYQKPGSLYDYFNDRKRPGGLLLDRFRTIGGDPNWLRYGTGSMFADNDAGRALRARYEAELPYTHIESRDKMAEGRPSLEPVLTYRVDQEVPMDQAEALYTLLSRILFRLRSPQHLPPHVLHMYRDLLSVITRELEEMESRETE